MIVFSVPNETKNKLDSSDLSETSDLSMCFKLMLMLSKIRTTSIIPIGVDLPKFVSKFSKFRRSWNPSHQLCTAKAMKARCTRKNIFPKSQLSRSREPGGNSLAVHCARACEGLAKA